MECCYTIALAQTASNIITTFATPEIVLRLYNKNKRKAEWVEKTLNFLTGDDRCGTSIHTLFESCDIDAFLMLIKNSDINTELKSWILTQPFKYPESVDPNCFTKLCNVEEAKKEFPKFLETWKTKEDVQSFIRRYGLRYHRKENPLGVKTYTGGIDKRTLTDIVNDLKKLLDEPEGNNQQLVE